MGYLFQGIRCLCASVRNFGIWIFSKMDISTPVLGGRILMMLQIFTEVNSWVTYVSLYNENQKICVQNNDEVDEWNIKCAKSAKICSADSPEESGQSSVKGEFFFDSNQMSDRNLDIDLCKEGCPSPSCKADNTTCKHHLKICCSNEESLIFNPKDPNVTAQCPIEFWVKSCRTRHHMTYHECVDSDQIGQFHHTSRYFWTSSYIRTLNTDDVYLNNVKKLNVTITTSKTQCLEYCLNLDSSTKVYYIAFNSSDSVETCQCFTKDPATKQPNFKRGKLYAIRNKTEDCEIYLEEGCIAVVYQNSTVIYSIQNCSSQYASLCGPGLSHQETCNSSPTSSRNPLEPSRNQDSSIEADITTTANKAMGNGLSSDSIKVIVLVGSLLMCVGFLCVITYLYSKRKNRRLKHVERARPNSISNRTYHLQQSTNTDEEELYTSITETADVLPEIRRPLLPPRNNTRQDHICHEIEYSTPSDAISPSIDVYTDTYDNPVRRGKGSSGETLDTPNVNKGTFEVSHIDLNKRVCSEVCAVKETDIGIPCNVFLTSTRDSKALSNHGCIRGAYGGYEQRTGIRDNSVSSHNTNTYFTLTKPMNNSVLENQSHEEGNVTLNNEGDNSDYEDTTIINRNFSISKSKSGFNVEQFPKIDAEEKSLLCTLSPYLLRELNIRIVPDNNEYAVNVIPRKSSSNINLSNVDLHGRVGNRQENTNPEADYDRLGYVERVMSAGRKNDLYSHVVLSNNKKKSYTSSNRRGTI